MMNHRTRVETGPARLDAVPSTPRCNPYYVMSREESARSQGSGFSTSTSRQSRSTSGNELDVQSASRIKVTEICPPKQTATSAPGQRARRW